MLKIFLVVVALYIAAMGYLYITQESQVFNAKAIEKEEHIEGANIEHITLNVGSAILSGIYKKADIQDAPVVLYFGGNADDATRFVLHVSGITSYDVISFNYRGYVKSSGEPSEKALFEDALKIYDTYAKGKKVIVVGRSLGSGVASFVASQRSVAGLVLITPYDSIASMAKKKYPIFPIDILLKHKFESHHYIPLVRAKIAVIEVENDKVIPRFHLEKLLEKMPQAPLHVSLSDTTHGRVLEHPDFEQTMQTILGKFSE